MFWFNKKKKKIDNLDYETLESEFYTFVDAFVCIISILNKNGILKPILKQVYDEVPKFIEISKKYALHAITTRIEKLLNERHDSHCQTITEKLSEIDDENKET